ncbi:hypothetical protein AB6G58_15035 [Providencia huaxiensis]
MNNIPTFDYLYARQFAYDVLRRLLIEEPTPELLNYLDNTGLALFPCDEALPAMKNAIEEMGKDLQSRTLQANADSFEDLHWDFTRLFIGQKRLRRHHGSLLMSPVTNCCFKKTH